MKSFSRLIVIQPLMFIVKLGGSVITDKSSNEGSFKHEIMDGLAESIQKSNQEIIIVHGAGSFGHVLAKKYNLNDGFSNKNQIMGFSLTHRKVQELNTLVLNSLQKKGIAAVSIPPHAIMTMKNHVNDSFQSELFFEYIKKGFTPVTFGDVVLDADIGFSICSGDVLIELLVKLFHPEKVIFVIDEDGLYTSNPKKDKDAEFINNISLIELSDLTTKLDDHADVTKGMEGKLQTIKTIACDNIDSILLNGNKPDRLYDVLVGNKTKYTLIKR